MKFGKKSHLISAYAALFTVAAGLLAWDSVRRSPAGSTVAHRSEAGQQEKTGHFASR